jgi:hypothetical protein
VTQQPVRGLRVQASHQGHEVLVLHRRSEAEHPRRTAMPHTPRLSRVEVVVRQGLHVVPTGRGALQRRHTHRHDDSLQMPVHSSVLLGLPESEFELLDIGDLHRDRVRLDVREVHAIPR